MSKRSNPTMRRLPDAVDYGDEYNGLTPKERALYKKTRYSTDAAVTGTPRYYARKKTVKEIRNEKALREERTFEP